MITQSVNIKENRKRIFAFIAAAVLLAGGGLFYTFTRGENGVLDKDTLRVSIIDVGKGDCILLQKGSHSMLIDSGYAETSDKVVSYLKNAGVTSLDCFVITHYHKDHVGGAADIIEAFDIDAVYLPDYDTPSNGAKEAFSEFKSALSSKNIQPVTVTEDITLSLGESGAAMVTIYASDIEYKEDEDGSGNHNDCSLVVSLINGSDRYLFAADLEKEGIESFLSKHSESYDVLKVPHHGNRKPATADFIEAVSPKIALITDSKDDSVIESVLEALKKAGSDIYQTSLNGTIIVESHGSADYSVL